MKTRILIAIPAFNCEKQISRVLHELLHEIPQWQEFEAEILIIDNRSTDKTCDVVIKNLNSHPNTKATLIKNHHNLGLGGSQKQAFLWASRNQFKYLVILHGDHQATPKEVLPLLRGALQRPALAAVLGSRFSRGSRRRGYSKVRTLGNRGLNILYSFLTFRRVEDLGSGLNVFNVSSFDLHRVTGYSNGFTFNMDLLLDTIEKRLSFQYSPITWTEFDQVSNARNFKVGWATLKTLLRWRLGLKKRQENLLGFNYETLWEQGK